MLREELSLKILAAIDERIPGTDTAILRGILDIVLYDYEIMPRERGLIVTNGFRDKIMLYVASKKLDGLSGLTLKRYYSILMKMSDAIHKEIETITVMDIRMYLAKVATAKDIQKSTLASQISVLRSFFTWMADQDYITKNPMRQIKTTKTEKRMRKALTGEELERLRDGCKTHRQRALVEFLFATGCRLSEIQQLNIEQVNWNDLTVRVIGKGNKERQVNFTPKARLYMRKYIGLRTSGPLFITSKMPKTRMAARSIQKEIGLIAKNCGFERPIFPHLLRHTHATMLLTAGMPISDISNDLGHSNIATTMVYAKTDPSKVRTEYQQRMAVG